MTEKHMLGGTIIYLLHIVHKVPVNDMVVVDMSHMHRYWLLLIVIVACIVIRCLLLHRNGLHARACKLQSMLA